MKQFDPKTIDQEFIENFIGSINYMITQARGLYRMTPVWLELDIKKAKIEVANHYEVAISVHLKRVDKDGDNVVYHKDFISYDTGNDYLWATRAYIDIICSLFLVMDTSYTDHFGVKIDVKSFKTMLGS